MELYIRPDARLITVGNAAYRPDLTQGDTLPLTIALLDARGHIAPISAAQRARLVIRAVGVTPSIAILADAITSSAASSLNRRFQFDAYLDTATLRSQLADNPAQPYSFQIEWTEVGGAHRITQEIITTITPSGFVAATPPPPVNPPPATVIDVTAEVWGYNEMLTPGTRYALHLHRAGQLESLRLSSAEWHQSAGVHVQLRANGIDLLTAPAPLLAESALIPPQQWTPAAALLSAGQRIEVEVTTIDTDPGYPHPCYGLAITLGIIRA